MQSLNCSSQKARQMGTDETPVRLLTVCQEVDRDRWSYFGVDQLDELRLTKLTFDQVADLFVFCTTSTGGLNRHGDTIGLLLSLTLPILEISGFLEHCDRHFGYFEVQLIPLKRT